MYITEQDLNKISCGKMVSTYLDKDSTINNKYIYGDFRLEYQFLYAVLYHKNQILSSCVVTDSHRNFGKRKNYAKNVISYFAFYNYLIDVLKKFPEDLNVLTYEDKKFAKTLLLIKRDMKKTLKKCEENSYEKLLAEYRKAIKKSNSSYANEFNTDKITTRIKQNIYIMQPKIEREREKVYRENKKKTEDELNPKSLNNKQLKKLYAQKDQPIFE